MSKAKKLAKPRDTSKPPAQAVAPPAVKSHALRETVESIVIAFVLAFLFRTFEAEAFVIPTGSMAPTLMGRHKDVDCPKCGYRYQVSASEEAPDSPNVQPSACIAGECPMCHYVMPMVSKDNLPRGIVERRLPDIEPQRSYNGDRILVNKYNYAFSDPKRWDVVVFKYPGDAKVNYIKRLVGLPGEKLRIFQGDLFFGDENAAEEKDFNIAHKPEEKVLAMRQLVHDTDFDPAELDDAGWPLRWQAPPGSDGGWKLDKQTTGNTVGQRYNADGGEGWLYYNHFIPDTETWQQLTSAQLSDAPPSNPPAPRAPLPRLITDANPYNGRIHQAIMPPLDHLEVEPTKLGVHWVGDLMLKADVDVESDHGELMLEIVEGGKHFRCTVDLANGEATLSAGDDATFAPKAKTALNKPGNYSVAFSNFDDELLLWVDDELVKFDASTAYDVPTVFGSRAQIQPKTSREDPGDLAPARIGFRDAKLSVSRLQLWRDIYYIAGMPNSMSDFPDVGWDTILRLPIDPTTWSLFGDRSEAVFPLGEDQFFVMGDNSAESSDARFWGTDPDRTGQLRGQYLDRRLLIGKALSVYWPHSWNRIPGTPIPFPLFPNFEDMRLVR